ncbi:hypothetical protein DP107_01310 [Haloglomus irregulare]|jgi:hypothetical protein|uniref:Uncharacterized protein n=1 Tax=Haloglomus irregulare TaxID=2234134 RepID=A0A554NFR8_9EURY|nr:DUF5804 family protein [Haloglomus irregulare]TSD15850.1 hypothetical protein DP107_01310 [Haloglomus irregulare]
MARVCLLGEDDIDLRYELLSRETAREALATYDLRQPYHNAVALETVSLGAAVALLNDLNWYLVRFVDEALVREPSVSGDEWLSRDLATALRDDAVTPAASGRFCKVYGVATAGEGTGTDSQAPDGAADDGDGVDTTRRGPARRLVDPMFVTRTGPELPTYDLRDVDGTVVVRVTETEFGA